MTCKHIVVQLCQDTLNASSIFVDSIDELSGAGVVFEGILVKDGIIDGRDISVDGANLDAHIADTSNPHNVTKEQLGLGPTDTPTFANVISNDPILGSHLATKDYVDSVSSGVFGTEIEFTSNIVPVTTTNTISSGGYISYLTLNTAIKPIGNYRVGWNFDWAIDSPNKDLLTKITIDTIIYAETRNGVASNTFGSDTDISAINGSGTNQRLTYSGFFYVTFGVAVIHDIKIEFTSEGPTGSVTLSNGKLEIWRVS